MRRRLSQWREVLFPERRLYLRCGDEMQALVLSPRHQMLGAVGLACAALWMGVCTAALLIDLLPTAPARNAVIASEPAQASPIALANLIAQRHAALAVLVTEASALPGAAKALAPPIAEAAMAASADPLHRLQAVEHSQDALLRATEQLASGHSQRLRQALIIAGVQPAAFKEEARPAPRLAETDAAFAIDAQRVAAELSDADVLDRVAQRLPLARPTAHAAQSSGFGQRTDPITLQRSFHPGLDFAGDRMTPVLATAAGVVRFAGERTGYGKTVEVDHGRGYLTRYAHLASIVVRPGQQVDVGARLGGMGSTGRSTGTHLHYEVWVNGRAQNPERFVRAGAYAKGAG